MFETFLQRFLAAIGAGDQLIAVMGPSVTVLLAWICGGAVAQFLKFPVSWYITDDRRFSWWVRTVAISATWGFMHWLSDTVILPLEIGLSMLQPLIYHASLAVIRRWWPWIETKKFVGSVSPPQSAFVANDLRQAEKSGQDSGA